MAIRDFRASGVEFEVLDESSIDLETPDGLLFSRIRAAFAQGEVEELSLRSRKGWEHLRRREVAVNVPFGYVKVNERHELDHSLYFCLLEDRSEWSKAMIARDVIDTFFEAKSLRKTIQILNQRYGVYRFNIATSEQGGLTRYRMEWSPSGLKNWLTNPVLCGRLSYLRDSKNPQIVYNTPEGVERS